MALEYRQLSEQVADHIRQLIAEGKIKAGEWLRQERLAEIAGVSPTPCREAVKLLVAEGLLEHLPNRGVRVVQFSIQDIEDIYLVRSILEGRAAAEAARKITAEEFEELRQILERMASLLAPEHINSYRKLNLRFHQKIASVSQRPYLIRMLNHIWAISPSMLWAQFHHTASAPLPHRTRADPEEHQHILEALQRHNPQEAEEAMRAHIEASGRSLIEAINQTPRQTIP